MLIDFATKELEKRARDPRYAAKKMGADQARIFFTRIGSLYSATSFEDLRYIAGHFHELKYGRKGQWGFDLNQPFRLILTPKTKPIAIDNDGKYVWDKICDVVIVEIINYHKEK